MGRAVELHQFALAGRAQTALTMSGRAAFAGRAAPGGTQDAAKGLAAEREAFLFDEFFVEVMVVKAGIARAGQMQQLLACAGRKPAVAGPAAAAVCQSRCAA